MYGIFKCYVYLELILKLHVIPCNKQIIGLVLRDVLIVHHSLIQT